MDAKKQSCEAILIALRRVIRAIDQHSRKLVQSHGLTGPQALVLNEIVRSGSLTGSRLAKNISLSQATVTDIVKRLEQKGLLAKKQDLVDKRKLHLLPTEQGRNLILTSVPLLQESFQQRLSELKEWEQTQLLASLQRIAEMMNAEDLDASPLLTSGALNASAEAVREAIDPSE
ncbi:MAG: MarR family transcriptional regulator [Gammaproteobacteria bacterium]|nr:MarR family transcriptional regulator [Gammaproteobacteria bacterium]